MEVAQGEGEVICAGPCVEGGDGWSAMTAWRSKAGLRRGGGAAGRALVKRGARAASRCSNPDMT
jgi:hypothetical protein